MRFEEFRNEFIGFPVVGSALLALKGGKGGAFRNQLSRWAKSGRLVRLRKDMYAFGESYVRVRPSRQFIAGDMYWPSYLSLEYALSFYGIIPEQVHDLTSVSVRKTAVFTNKFGVFRYRRVKEEFFAGFVSQKDESGFEYYIALPEKAVADFIYLNRNNFGQDPVDELVESYRFDVTTGLDRGLLRNYAGLSGNPKTIAIMKEFIKLCSK